ncbi:MAG TPA: flagellar basal body P-ring protein FlgI [Polyangiaceae bacterium]|nr:flagellar basal body P-ring protein FlgI [Polyangiaceae bacterium]
MARSALFARIVAGFALSALLAWAPNARADRLRDLCDVVGARDNQLVGYGIVTGLNGTGDDLTAPFAMQSLRALLRRLGVQVDGKQMRLKNIAAVIVTANIPAFVRNGSRLDVTVSSIGNSKSLRGGVLIQTPLRGADRKTYAVAQGAILLGGFSAGSGGSSVQDGVTTTARIPNGALVEREIQTAYAAGGKLTLSLKNPDFSTAQRILMALEKDLGKGAARALDGGAIEVTAPKALAEKPVELMARLSDLEVDPVAFARVVINERTGTVVAGGDVRLSPVAIAQGGITISVQETHEVSQPGVLSGGQTRDVKNAEVKAEEQKPAAALTYLGGATTLADVAQALSTFGVSPRELASILQALKAAGALRAEVIIQ